jgi:AraC-like DNA-binding protein
VEPDAFRGVLFPARLPTFSRVAAPEPVAGLVRHFWIPEWDLSPGRVSRQHVLGYPAANLAVEPDLVGLAGPTTVRSHRDLSGSGWTVGAMLWPAAVPALCTQLGTDPASTVDAYLEVDAPDLHAAVATAMGRTGEPEERHAAAVAAFTAWLRDRCGEPDEQALLANEMVRLAETDAGIRTTAELAGRLAVSESTLQRLARTYVGLPPHAIIRRRRLQEAAERLRRVAPEVEDETIAAIAAELGYADHAHLTRDFGAVLGWTPRGYRNAARTSPSLSPYSASE